MQAFLTPDGKARVNWQQAFPTAICSRAIAPGQAYDIVWVQLPEQGDIVQLLAECRAAAGHAPLIALSDTPNDEQGMAALGAGATGYCNGHAAPALLQQVASTVLNGGVWLGQSLLHRLVKGMAQLAAGKFAPPAAADWGKHLTEREIAVAQAAAAGAHNKEIAEQLAITERTVKAHLGAAFEKLGVRDRLQLTLLVNGVTKR